MRARTWIFTALAAVLFAVNLALVSTRIAQTGEDTVRERLLQAATALHAQLELIDARLSPKAAAEVPELTEVTKASADPAQPPPRPDERALRAAASALAPEPDLLAVVNAQGALVSRRARPVEMVTDIAQLPLAKAALERSPLPSFAVYQGTAYRIAAARVPGSAAAVLAGAAADDRLAAQLKTQVDADVTLIAHGEVVASSLPAEARERVSRWAAAPGPGYGVLPVVLPGIGGALSGRLPRGASRYAVRGTLVPLDGGLQAALTVPASPYVGWLARYQAFSLLALALLVLFGFAWGLLYREPARAGAAPAARPEARPVRRPRAVVGTDAGEGRSGVHRPAGDVPWTSAAAPEAVAEPAVVVGDLAQPAGPSWDAAAEDGEAASEPAVSAEQAEAPALSNPALSEPGPSPAAGAAGADGRVSDTSAAEPAAKTDFSFAGLLDDAAAPLPPPATPLAVQQGEAEWASAVDAGQRPATDREAHGEPPGPAATDVRDAWSAPPTPSATPAAEQPGFEMLAPSSDLEMPAPPQSAAAAPSAELQPGAAVSAAAIEREYLARPKEAKGAMAFTEPFSQGAEVADARPIAEAHRADAPPADAPRPEPQAAAEASAGEAPAAAAEAFASETSAPEMSAAEPPAEAPAAEAPATEAPAAETSAAETSAAETSAAETSATEAPEAPATESPATEAPATEAAAQEADPDEAHWRETYDQFIALRQQLGEPGRISYERFAAKLAKNREELMARRQCRGARFSVYEKEGRASIKASAVR